MNIVREQREQNNSLIKVTVGEKDYGDAVEKSLREYKRSVFALRLTPIRLGLSKKAPLSLGMADTASYISIATSICIPQASSASLLPSAEAGGIGHPQRAVRLYFRPKLVSVKRRDRSERPERLLSERSEFQTRQRTKETE